jgi:hypothetical protein
MSAALQRRRLSNRRPHLVLERSTSRSDWSPSPSRHYLNLGFADVRTDQSRAGKTQEMREPAIEFEHGGSGIGFFDDAGQQPAEIFLTTAKHGTALDTNARDAAIAASFLLQHGCPVETLRRALTRNGDGSASGPLAHVLDLLL